jgi:uncharacterized protein YijF (DUF1287 family)
MIHTAAALLLLGSVDQGIFPDLRDRVRVHAPSWSVSDGPVIARIDDKHRLLTLLQGGVGLAAYPIVVSAEQLAGLSRTPRREEVLTLLDKADADEVRASLAARVSDSVAPFPVLWGAPPKHEDRDGDGIVNTLDVLLGAKKLCENKAAYVSNYRQLAYPNGDVPRTEGVCTDTLVRALRNAGWDMQSGVHEDAIRKPRLYPLEKAPDANIDHRRIRMLLPYFRQFFVELKKDAPFLPGDLVLFDTFPSKAGPDHAGIVSDRLGPSGQPLIINNWTDGYVEGEMDLLPTIPVTHRFRVPMTPR